MITQAEADDFMQMVKHFVRPPATITIPPGIDETHELASLDDRERFLLDVWRGTLRLAKLKFQNRVRTVIVLARLDVDGSPHTNPDGQTIPGTHLHVFREGYDDKWAYPVSSSVFTLLTDPGTTFQEFCAFCNIESAPSVQGVIV
ncbi:MAG TPA: hypothetical protein VHV29_09145 [Terriglobales bacterium]|jgi:hypothetical protein|nr:hypothetical protein [Terriglobales bacterium]